MMTSFDFSSDLREGAARRNGQIQLRTVRRPVGDGFAASAAGRIPSGLLTG